MGYNGRGVAMATVMGRVLAEWALSEADKPMAFPKTRPTTFPLHRFHPQGAWIGMKWGSFMDAFEHRFL
jgi:glycine/D-amino acid oxidase-like deaminating enzyme